MNQDEADNIPIDAERARTPAICPYDFDSTHLVAGATSSTTSPKPSPKVLELLEELESVEPAAELPPEHPTISAGEEVSKGLKRTHDSNGLLHEVLEVELVL